MPDRLELRKEHEMMELILDFAKKDERVRAAYMSGSRANPSIKKDIFQDYDIAFVVKETRSFIDNMEWLKAFGEILIMQEPDNNDFGFGINADFDKSYGWLVIFTDGNRIDFSIETREKMLEGYNDDGLTIVLLDKDNCLPQTPPSTDESYYVKKPGVPQYKGCCNEFWWCLNNVAKGIARDELPYAMWMYNVVVRDMIEKMLEWRIGISTEFSVSAGKQCKLFKKYLPPDIYEAYVKTYTDGDYDNFWRAIFTACELFRTAAKQVGGYFGFTYNQGEDDGMMRYLCAVKQGLFG